MPLHTRCQRLLQQLQAVAQHARRQLAAVRVGKSQPVDAAAQHLAPALDVRLPLQDLRLHLHMLRDPVLPQQDVRVAFQKGQSRRPLHALHRLLPQGQGIIRSALQEIDLRQSREQRSGIRKLAVNTLQQLRGVSARRSRRCIALPPGVRILRFGPALRLHQQLRQAQRVPDPGRAVDLRQKSQLPHHQRNILIHLRQIELQLLHDQRHRTLLSASRVKLKHVEEIVGRLDLIRPQRPPKTAKHLRKARSILPRRADGFPGKLGDPRRQPFSARPRRCVTGKSRSGERSRQLELERRVQGLHSRLLIPHQDRKQPLVRVHTILVRRARLPGLLHPLRRFAILTMLGQKFGQPQPRLAPGARFGDCLTRQSDRAFDVAARGEECGRVVQSPLLFLLARRAGGELAQQLVLRRRIPPRPEKGRQIENRLRLLRLTRHAGAEDSFHHRVERPVLGKHEQLLLHIRAGLGVQELFQPPGRAFRIAAAQISLAAQQHDRRQVAAVALQPLVQQCRRLCRALVVQQRAHQLPAVVLHLRHRLHQRLQPDHSLLHLHGDLKKSRRVEHRLLCWRCLLRRLHQRLPQVVQQAEPLVQTHTPTEKVHVAPVPEVQHRQPVPQRRIGLGELIRVLVNPCQIVKRIQLPLRILLIGQLRKKSRRAIREPRLEQELRHLPRQPEVIRPQLRRRLPCVGGLCILSAAQRQITDLDPDVSAPLLQHAGQAFQQRDGRLRLLLLHRHFRTSTQRKHIPRVQFEHLVILPRRTRQIPAAPQQMSVHQHHRRMLRCSRLSGDVLHQQLRGVVLVVKAPQQVQHPPMLRLLHQEGEILVRQPRLALCPRRRRRLPRSVY